MLGRTGLLPVVFSRRAAAVASWLGVSLPGRPAAAVTTNGVKAFGRCRQQNAAIDVNDYLMGTEGTCDVMKHTISGKKPWRYKAPAGDPDDMYQNEHNELFASLRNGKPINDGERMSLSTLLAIMGRMAGYTGKVITWEMALNSKEDLTPSAYEMGPLPVPPVAMPGRTPFI